jgi:hypothetical protein
VFEWYTNFDDYLDMGIEELNYWCGYKKLVSVWHLEKESKDEGLELIRQFVNLRARLYAHRTELDTLFKDKGKALSNGDLAERDKIEAREAKIREKCVVAIWKGLELRPTFDDWMAYEGLPERPRSAGGHGSEDDDD